jgi:hypothetical protein
MQDKRKIPLGDEMVDAVSVPYRSSVENWNEYFLDDGSVIRMKTVATEIFRVEGKFDAGGDPVYIVRSTNVMNVQATEKLRKGESST